ncbi:MAG TPA: beta-ketoacyl synthase N-terminal-like domain-containing protein, partial [Kofleriaceae bacterium]|nr:beta-ketoacyl synthase N-terminal-like domain-containing protein [Kofleriaceae bacterium]
MSSFNIADWEDDNLRRFGAYEAAVVGGRVWTSGALHDASRRLAAALVAIGVAPGDRVLVVLPNCAELFVVSNAVWRCGGVVVLAFVGSPVAELDRIIAHSTPSVLVTGRDVLGDTAEIAADLRTIVVGAGAALPPSAYRIDALAAEHAPLEASVPRAAEDLAQISYTSGTTGTPKAVMYTHGATDALLRWRTRDEDATISTVEIAILPPAAFAARVMRTRTASRHKLILLNDFDPAAMCSTIALHRVTRLALVPTMCEALLAFPGRATCDLSSLREIMVAGASVSTSLADRMAAAFGVRPSVHYGMAELGGPVTWPGPQARAGSVGRVAPGAALRIMAAEGTAAPTGAVGEVHARSPWMATGYYGEPAATAAVFRDGWLRTGDVGLLDPDGELFLVGRSKDLIIQSGVNVHPQEVVEVIQRVPGVGECAVLGLPSAFLGEEVVACVVRRPGASVTEDQIRARCRAEIDSRKVPVVVRFVDALPRNPVGKIAVHVLRDQLLAERDAVVDTDLVRRLRAASPEHRAAGMRDAIARQLSRVLGSAEGASGDRTWDPTASFGSLGLKSLGAVQLANGLTEILGRPVPVTITFRHPTVDKLATELVRQLVATAEAASPRGVEPASRSVADSHAFAIVSMACRLPGGVTSPAQFWDLLRDGRDTVGAVPAERWRMADHYDPTPGTPGKTCTRYGSFLDDAALFDAGFFGLTWEAERIDPQHRLLLETSWDALETAVGDPRAIGDGLAVGVFFGISGSSYASPDALGRAPSSAVARLCHFLDLRGPAVTVDTACSSSLVAVHHGVQSLRSGECDIAVVGSANVMCSPEAFVDLAQLGVLAADGRSKAFSADGDGFGRGEGCVVLVLKRLADARAAGDRIHAVVRGSAIGHDGRSSSLTAPNPQAQAQVIRSALAASGVSPERVQYVEAHGTGTILGDPIEVDGLASVFGGVRAAPLAIGSVKTNIGHIEAAAGLAGLLKIVLAMEHRQLPASLNFTTPNPHIPWGQIPIRVQAELGAWPTPDAPLIAGVSSFGISGTNAHVVLEEAPREPERSAELVVVAERSAELVVVAERSAELVVVSGQSEAAVAGYAERLRAQVERHPEQRLGDVAYSLATGRAHHAHRLAVSVRSRDELIAALAVAAGGELPAGGTRGEAAAERGKIGKVMFVFPGQGGQWAGMGRELLDEEPVFRDRMAACDRAIRAEAGWSVVDELRSGRSARLAQVDGV